MDKVKIIQELADAIDGVIKHADENILYDVTYIKNVCEGDKFDAPKLMPIYNFIQKVGFKDYFKILVVGYEVELSKEERVRNAISDFCNGAQVSQWLIDQIREIYEGVNHE